MWVRTLLEAFREVSCLMEVGILGVCVISIFIKGLFVQVLDLVVAIATGDKRYDDFVQLVLVLCIIVIAKI